LVCTDVNWLSALLISAVLFVTVSSRICGQLLLGESDFGNDIATLLISLIFPQSEDQAWVSVVALTVGAIVCSGGKRGKYVTVSNGLLVGATPL
jgi:hypothetical protein